MVTWAEIAGFSGLYSVSSAGDVWSHRKSKIMRPGWAGRGYLQVHLHKGGAVTHHYVHVLVAKAFVSGFFDGAEVNHVDGNKRNNTCENLEWVTSSENKRHAYSVVRGPSAMPKGAEAKHAKTYRVTHPDGSTEVVRGLADFCRTHGLRTSHMSSVASGNRPHHKQFRCELIS